jgi:DeoR/GlpR family transcriptional regulator of sugar metabolism
MKLSKSERQNRILTELNGAPSLRVSDLARRLDVSTETIRRDLDEMTQQGLLNRTYGGAIRPLSTEPCISERHTLFVSERERIGKATMPLIKGARVLMIGSGSTTTHVARRIAIEMRDLTVVTHSFSVATVLSINPTIKVLILPGDYHATEGATVGAHTVSFLGNLFADHVIIGASGLTLDGPSDALIEFGAVYSAMVMRSANCVVVADHSKHDLIFASQYAGWCQVGDLVTDVAPSGPLHLALQNGRVKTHIT